LGGIDVFPVAALRPLTARSVSLRTRLSGRRLALWLQYDGRRASLQALLGPSHRAVPLSAVGGDIFFASVSPSARGRIAVAFVEVLRARARLRLAVLSSRHWRLTTLDTNAQPIWPPRVRLLDNGGVVVAWIDEQDPMRTIHVASVEPSGRVASTTLDTAAAIGAPGLGAVGNRAILVWPETIAGETRIRATVLARGSWTAPVVVATSLDPLSHVKLKGTSGVVRWLDTSSYRHPRPFESRLVGRHWTPPSSGGAATTTARRGHALARIAPTVSSPPETGTRT
jgi:hypothetical protein